MTIIIPWLQFGQCLAHNRLLTICQNPVYRTKKICYVPLKNLKGGERLTHTITENYLTSKPFNFNKRR
jgi:hypothetical protein